MRPTAAVFLFFLLLLLAPSVHSQSKAGEGCDYTRNCSEGYCLNKVCTLPPVSSQLNTTSCNTTSDCSEGYCLNGGCILPTSRGELIGFGIKSGCAGIAEETGALGSFAVCDIMWILVFVFSIAAAYSSYRRGNDRLITAAFFFLPFFLALILFPFLGLLTALVELAVIAERKRKAPSY
ncbi:Uncharacterised protein [Candidatus Burarchaeum australiense]|nr:Uncharacterised protein [Candidatus Burarchaeum australiense]